MQTERVQFFAPADLDSISDHCATCPSSKHCCYRAKTIVVLRDEVERIIDATRRPEVLEKQCDDVYIIKKDAGQPCPFLTPHGTCGIYDIRPRDCRTWPITHADPPRHGHYSADSNCPAVAADVLPSEFLEHAIKTLWSIPKPMRAKYAQLVHRDEAVLPLKAVNLNLQHEKEKS